MAHRSRFFLGTLLLPLPFLLSCEDSSTGPDAETVSVGVMLAVTGGSPTDVVGQQAIVEVAAEDINQYFADHDIAVEVVPVIVDNENSPEGVAEALAHLAENEMSVVAASGISANLDNARAALASFEGIVIHATSTAVSLAREDNLYRVIPTDLFTAGVLADRM